MYSTDWSEATCVYSSLQCNVEDKSIGDVTIQLKWQYKQLSQLGEW